ncbi:DNA-processing protein DprA [Mesonia maritima]|uniref:DNA processing protein n=1 Tax=Mesonia maritima TaxID=1793873 RepID=A0ABU1K292_9FLAO|nr:DNA-processing protein DprA [Mesonia maritima]MDR6299720.1 DNA processing protein [Mesonia maritima]
MTTDELLALLTLQRVRNLGDISAKKLLRVFGSAEKIFNAKPEELLAIEGIGKFKISDLHNPNHKEEAKEELEFITSNNIEVRYFKDSNYPENLKHCIDAPILLFQRGNIHLENKRLISIVGTRKATNQGLAFCEELIEKLAPLNPVIISGFAYGVDICAHKAALKNNLQTVGCLAHGLNQIYPKTHAKYQDEVLDYGGFITDFWSDSNFDRKNFLKRNRIIAGLSEATIVIESAEKGGSLVTADIANSYNREVFAVPGRTTDKFSKGCNNLIKSQQAHMLTCAEDLIYLLNWDLESKPTKKAPELFVNLTEEEEKILATLQQGKTELDELSHRVEIPTFKLVPLLLNLELNNLIRPLPGKIYEVI